MTVCSVIGCERPHRVGGMCKPHYDRMRRHGDPNAGRTAPGELQRFYEEVVLRYDGDECLIWPYGRAASGYAQMKKNGKYRTVSRFVCEDIYGPPPPEKNYSAHSCGNGHLGCVSKKHLSWKTQAENMADRLLHGTDDRGGKHKNAKLTEEKVRQIISLKGKCTQKELAVRFGVSYQHISGIHCGKRWNWLQEQAA